MANSILRQYVCNFPSPESPEKRQEFATRDLFKETLRSIDPTGNRGVITEFAIEAPLGIEMILNENSPIVMGPSGTFQMTSKTLPLKNLRVRTDIAETVGPVFVSVIATVRD